MLPFTPALKATLGPILLLAGFLLAGCGSPEDRAQSYYQRGMTYLAQQDYAKAGIEFRNALQLKKDLVGAWRGLAQIEEHNKNWQGFASVLRTVIELDSKDVESRLKLARIMLVGQQFDQALDLVNDADAIDSRNADVIASRAAILLRLNDPTGAKREAQAALELDPANSVALVVLAAERMRLGDASGALAILDRQSSKHAEDLGVQLFKAVLFEKLGDLEKLEQVFRKLTELYPQEAVFRTQLINFYVLQKRPQDAERELRAMLAANPKNVQVGLDIARFLLRTQGPDAARQELLNLISGGPAFPYQMALADFDYNHGRVNDSIQLLEKLAKTASRDEALTAQFKLAQIHLRDKKLDAAEAIVSDILNKDSRNIGGLKLRAQIRLEKQQLDAAIADARQALNDQPRSADLMLLLAEAYERSGSIELAEKQYADATRTANFDAAVGLNYATFLRRRGNPERAEDVLTELVSRSPTNVALLTSLADIRLSRQNWIGAQEIAEKIRQLGNQNNLADQILGVALSGRGKYEDSLAALESAYAAAPTSLQPLTALVNGFVRAQKVDRAVTFLETILQSSPDNVDALVLLGDVQQQKNNPAEAVKSYRAAIERQPDNMAGYRALAEHYVRQHKLDEALTVSRDALQREPNNFGMRLILGGVLESQGNYEGAIAEFERLLKQQPGSLVVANNLASLLSDHRTDKESLDRAYSLAASLRKTQVPNFKDTLGWIYYQRGEHKNALSLLEEAVAALPNSPVARYHLGMSYLSDGQLAKASEQLKKALELSPDPALQQKIRTAQTKAAI
jgi:tetratricopeptide (TPR) repeat protein